jgi:sugar/nucleoside kinase (ribokinase family)
MQRLLTVCERTAGLAAGFGVRCGIVGARGMDENGAFFQSSLKRAHVHTERLRVLRGGSTGAVL